MPSGQSRVYRATQLRTGGVHCRESAGTGSVHLKVVANECYLGRSVDQLICASLSHTHYWYEADMLKVPAYIYIYIYNIYHYFFISLVTSIADGPHSILPVVTITITKEILISLSLSPRLTPYDFLSRCEFSTLIIEVYLLAFSRFPLRKKERTKVMATRIELTTCALAGVQITY